MEYPTLRHSVRESPDIPLKLQILLIEQKFSEVFPAQKGCRL